MMRSSMTLGRRSFTLFGACAACLGGARLLAGNPAAAQPPPTTVQLAPNAHAFRYLGYQSLFVVTPEGVIATDPSGRGRPQAVAAYLAEIRKITQAPIRYLIYSHHHYDHIAGGAPFKAAGATVVAHHRARDRLALLRNPEVVPVDEAVPDSGRVIELGGTRLELHHVGRNHSDNMLVMLLPRERLVFVVDFIPVEGVAFRHMPDSYLPDWFDSLDRVLALEWDRLLPGHPGPGGRLGTKEDVRNFRQYLTDLSEATRQAAQEGKCYDRAMREVRLPRYERWGGYEQYLPGNVERFCGYWSVGE